MADTNKRLNLELDLNDKNFRDKIKGLISEISRANDQVGAPSQGNYSNLPASERHRIEQSRYQEVSSKFYKQYNEDAIVSARANVRNKGAFARPEDQYVAQTSKQLENLQKALQESSNTQKMSDYEQKNRQREFRSLTTKQLEVEKDRLRTESKKADKEGDYDTADSKQRDIAAIESVLHQRDSRSPELKYMQKMATNMFIGKTLESATGLMGHGTQHYAQAVNTGFNAYSAARAAGMSKVGGGLLGLAGGALDFVVNKVTQGKDLDIVRKQAQGLGNYENDTYMNSNLDRLGIDQTLYQEKYNERQRNSRFQAGLGRNVIEEQQIQKGFGLSEGDLKAITDYQVKGGNSTAETLSGFTAALQNLGIVNTDQKEKDLSLLPKYLEKMVVLQEKIYNVTGERSDENTLKSMSLMTMGANLGGIFKDERQGADLVAGAQNKFTNPGDEYEKYINLQAMRSVFGNINDTELRKKQEAMSGSELADVTNEKVKLVRQRYGNQRNSSAGRYAYLQTLQAALGLDSITKTEKFDQQFDKNGGLKVSDITKDKTMMDLVKNQSEANTNKLDAAGVIANKQALELGANGADKAGDLLQKGATMFDEAVNSFGDFVSDLMGFKDKEKPKDNKVHGAGSSW